MILFQGIVVLWDTTQNKKKSKERKSIKLFNIIIDIINNYDTKYHITTNKLKIISIRIFNIKCTKLSSDLNDEKGTVTRDQSIRREETQTREH